MKKSIHYIFVLFVLCVSGVAKAQIVPSVLVPGSAEGLSLLKGNDLSGQMLLSGKNSVGLSGGLWAPGSSDNLYLGASAKYRPDRRLMLELGFKRLSDLNESVGFLPNGTPSEPFKTTEMKISAGAGYEFLDGFSAGVRVAYVGCNYGNNLKGSGVTGDLFVSYKLSGFVFSLGAENIGTSVRINDRQFALPGLASFDAYYCKNGLEAHADVRYLFSGGVMADAGLEYCVAEIVSFRAGYHFGSSAAPLPSFASAGLGVKLFGVSLDASYLFASETLGGTVMLSFGYEF